MKATRFLICDTETTGIDSGKDRVVELAAVEMLWDGEACSLGRSFSSLVNPGMPIPPGASAVHHLTDELVADAAPLDQVLTVADLVALDPSQACLVAHNAAFDAGFLPDPWKPTLCTWRMALHLWPGAEKHSNQFLRYAMKLKVPEAEGMMTHRAMADAHVTAAILSYGLATLRTHQPELLALWDDGEAMAAWCRRPVLLNTCRFGNKHYGQPWTAVPKDYLRWMQRNVLDMDMDSDTRHTVEVMLAIGEPPFDPI